MINPAIFRQYDIRGIWEKDLTPETVELLGRGYASYLLKSINRDKAKISVGWDARLHSPAIRDNLIKGLTESGIDVIDLGMCPTPLQYYSLYTMPVDGGVMITGSHNPPEFNGFKLSVGKSTIFGDAIQEIRKIIDAGDFRRGSATVENYPITDEYVNFVKGKFESLSGIKVVVDAGNGTGGLVAPEIMKALGAEVIELYCEPDGNFPNHHPDPTLEESLVDLIAEVKKEKAHAGIGYDGDADRIGVVDEEGNVIWGDRLMIIFSRDILKDNPGAKIIGEVKCSQTLYDDVAADGIRIKFDDGWALIRASNTQPVLVLRFEAQSDSRLREIRSLVEERLNKIMEEVKTE